MTLTQIFVYTKRDFNDIGSRLLETTNRQSEPDIKRKAHLLALLSLCLVIICWLGGALWYFLLPGHLLSLSIALVSGGIFALVYFLNRHGDYHPAAVLTVMILSAIAFGLVLNDSHNLLPFTYLLIGVLLSSILLSLHDTMILMLLNGLGILTTLLIIHENLIGIAGIALTPLYVTLFCSLTVLLTTHFRDVLEQDRLMEIKLGEQKYRDLLEQASDGILIRDLKGRYLEVNPRACEMLGYSREELLSLSLSDLTVPEELAEMPKRAAILEAGERLLAEYQLRRKDGSVITTENSSKKLTDGRIQTIMRDVTQRKRAEVESIEVREELERRVIERTASLVSLNAELEAYSFSVSHDLRAPLRAIDGFAQALLEDYGEQFDATGQNYLKRIRAASQRMGSLIDALLKLSRINRIDFKPETVNLSTIAEEVAELMQHGNPERQVNLHIQPGVYVSGDAGLLFALLENLIGNAWKFTGKVEHPQITFGTIIEADRTVCFVQDNGAGFDMTYADKLFTAFQRLHSETQFTGTGVGLATVKRIILRHGGQVWAKSAVDAGATFYFTLPELRTEGQ